MKGMYETCVKVDYVRSWIDRDTINNALIYMKEDLESMMPENYCSSSNDFFFNWGESYIDFIGFTGRLLAVEDFNDMTNRLILDNSQDAVEGLEINVHIYNGEFVAQYHYENDIWKEIPADQTTTNNCYSFE